MQATINSHKNSFKIKGTEKQMRLSKIRLHQLEEEVRNERKQA